jgi:hypothetical protein
MVLNMTRDTVEEWLASRFSNRSQGDVARVKRRSTWFYQQFLKLAVAAHIPGLSDYFLIFDSEFA